MGIQEQARFTWSSYSQQRKIGAQGFSQIEGVDYGETYAPVARLDFICLLIAYASTHNIVLYQIDVKSAFFNGPLNELVYVKQPPGFKDPKFPNHVYFEFCGLAPSSCVIA